MRVIDADNLISIMQKACEREKGYGTPYAMMKWFMNIIDSQPTVDAVPVVHAEWEQLCDPYFSTKIPTISRCTACGKKYNLGHLDYNFCPECGAKMEGKKVQE